VMNSWQENSKLLNWGKYSGTGEENR